MTERRTETEEALDTIADMFGLVVTGEELFKMGLKNFERDDVIERTGESE